MAPSPTIRRLLREITELSSSAPNPNPSFHAAPVSDSNLHEWHFTLLGPPAPSPYAGGMYHGRILLPATYPLKPPNFRFLTPSGRFETNREICLSISGFHEETWMPAWGVRTALTALRTFMAEQGTAGQVGGLEASREVRERLAGESKGWRCTACEKTNEVILKEWWVVCRESGLKVAENGEEVGLEVLPEGLSLEARDPSGPQSPHQSSEQSREQSQQQRDSPQRQLQREVRQRTSSIIRGVQPSDGSVSGATIATPSSPDTPMKTILGHDLETYTVPSTPSASSTDEVHARQRIPNSSEPAQPALQSDRSASNMPPPTRASTIDRRRIQFVDLGPANIITIDRAIGALVLALCLMILKKIFYPATGASLDDYYLSDG